MSLLVTDGTLVTQDEERRVVRGNLRVEANRITEVGETDRPADRHLHAGGCLVLPGLINGYTRTSHLLLGPPQDLPWEAMQKAMAALRASLTKRDLEVAAALATAEMLASGTTCFVDLDRWEEEVSRAVTQAGMRAVLAWAVEDEDDLASARRFLRKMEHRNRVVPMVGVSGLADRGLTEAVAGLAGEEGVRWCVPLAERRSDVYGFQGTTGKRPVVWLEEAGHLSPDLLVFHGVWLTLNEIRSLARGRVAVIHCPASNQMTGAGGPMPLPEMLREGIVVGLGTDSPYLSGTLDLRGVARTAGLVHRGNRWDPTIVPAQVLLDLATVQGAQALGLDAGGLQVGQVADFVVMEAGGAHAGFPTPEEALSLLVYGGRALRVRDVVVDGKLVVEGGAVRGFDVADLRNRVLALRGELGLANPGD